MDEEFKNGNDKEETGEWTRLVMRNILSDDICAPGVILGVVGWPVDRVAAAYHSVQDLVRGRRVDCSGEGRVLLHGYVSDSLLLSCRNGLKFVEKLREDLGDHAIFDVDNFGECVHLFGEATAIDYAEKRIQELKFVSLEFRV